MSTLTNLILPKTSATITLRIVKSFEYRIQKSVVLCDVDLESITVGGLKEQGRQVIHTQPGWKPFRTVILDTLKLYTQAHGAKTSNLIINLDHEELVLDNDEAFLADVGFGDALHELFRHPTVTESDCTENETEVSFFNKEAYEKFKNNPQTKWD